MKTVRSMFVAFASLTILASVSVPSAPAAVTASFTPLTLENGWTNAPFSTRNAAVATINGIVHFRGAIAGGTDPVAFTLPASFRPSTDTYVPVDLCDATNGRLYIQPSGVAEVEAETNFSDAQCFTSLEGVSFVNASGSTLLTLRHGWTNAPFSTRNARVRVVNGIVHFQGAIAGGTSDIVFRLPTGFRPSTDTYVPVDLCDATKGRLYIQPTGVTRVAAEGGVFSNAQCFTSLEGVSFVNTSGSTALTLKNGWTNAPFSTRNARVRVAGGIVRLQGAIAGGSSSVVFRLPTGFRPSTNVYVPVDLCNAANGRLVIQPSGVTSVEAESSFTDAQCFTSLEGAWFAL